MKPKKILQILPFESDNWKSIYRYANHIKNGTVKSDNSLTIHQYIPDEKYKIFGNFIARRVILPLTISQKGFDVIHYCDASYSNLIQKGSSVRQIVTCHDLEFWKNKNAINYLIRYHLLRKMFQANIIIVPSEQIKSELLDLSENLNISVNCRVIHNCVTDNFFIPKSRASLVPQLLYIGNYNWPRKNFSFLLEVLENLNKKNFEFNLNYIGPALNPTVTNLIRSKGFFQKIKAHNYVEEEALIKIYEQSDLLLMPSKYEGFGYPLIEAGATNTPFMASNIPVFNEITSGKVKLLNLDINVWSDAIIKLFEDRSLLKKLGEECNQISQNFRTTKFIEKYRALYCE